jgi:hypothetical protein
LTAATPASARVPVLRLFLTVTNQAYAAPHPTLTEQHAYAAQKLSNVPVQEPARVEDAPAHAVIIVILVFTGTE